MVISLLSYSSREIWVSPEEAGRTRLISFSRFRDPLMIRSPRWIHRPMMAPAMTAKVTAEQVLQEADGHDPHQKAQAPNTVVSFSLEIFRKPGSQQVFR